ncbi:SDR family NAD(P)-dependent oxidoreductase [Angustibacter luteus]|uniref:SDR family NAD(P)-dependent oxidoreductase n=1 Tax=Angustibacter luteus TaxID=658456 RepID=A0ABW1JAR7_9ACTN
MPVPESSDRVALVTGAGRGIGRAVAIALSRQGLRVALTARSAAELAETAQACPADTLVVPADLLDLSGVDQVFDQVEDAWGPVTDLVLNAGTSGSARIERTSDEDWQHTLDLNLTAPFRCVRRAVPAMRASGNGRIVAIASVAGKVGEPYIAAYTASKHGLLGLVRSAAAELAGDGVTVNAVCPGYVDTPMTDATVRAIAAATGRTPEQARDALARKQPTGRLVTPDEVADVVLLCLANPSITGQAINVDGGAVQS